MKIVQIFNQYLDKGGEQNSVERMARQLEAEGHEVIRFWKASSEWVGDQKPGRMSQMKRFFSNKDVLSELEAIHDREEPDVWIAHNVVPVVSLGVYGLARRKKVVLMQWLHNYRPLCVSGKMSVKGKALLPATKFKYAREVIAGEWRNRISSLFLALGYQVVKLSGGFAHVASWVAVSEQMKEHFRECGWYNDRLESLHHSWEMVESPEDCGSEGYFLFLGRIMPEKGVGQIVDIFCQDQMQNHKLVIAGAGEYEAELKHRATSNIEFAGFVTGDDKRKLIRRAKCLLFPSLWEEPLSTIAYESYEQERPIIASDAGGMKEIVVHDVTGLVIASRDKDAWERAIIDFDTEKAKSLGLAGREWLKTNVSGAVWVKKFEKLVVEAKKRI